MIAMNPDLQRLHQYPFEKLNQLKAKAEAPPADKSPIFLSIGEPKHAPPPFVLQTLESNLAKLSVYPATKGSPELRESIAQWLTNRFNLTTVNVEEQVLPVNGTREALFSFAQAVVDRNKEATVIAPNPFYQIYEGATFLAGANLVLVNCDKDNNYCPNFDAITDDQWRACQLLYICSPGNPTGAVIPTKQLQALIELAQRFDFVIASDECYSEIYFNDQSPPPGLLQACAEMGNDKFERCVVFHSLSKRSNLPGLRSGFVAGDANILKPYLLYRTYHGCAMPQPSQLASIAAWQDEDHVEQNRKLYQQKFAAVLDILRPQIDLPFPDASFYIWLPTPIDERTFARELYSRENITVLPGSFLSRKTKHGDPGTNHVRIALVAEVEECIDAANRIAHFLQKI